MKKLYFMLMLCVALAFTSCTNSDNNGMDAASIIWNVEVTAKGQGKFVLAYPTGKLDLEGAACAIATSSNDTTTMLMANLADAPKFSAIMANPDSFSTEQVQLANEVNSAFHVDTLAGTWNVDIVGYARYGQIYIVIDQHWPEQAVDSVADMNTDTVKVAE